MKKYLIAFLLLAISCVSVGQTQEEKLNDVLQTYARLNSFNGCALVYHKGQLLLNRGYGYQDVADKKNNYTHTIFQLGSVTKQFTAAIILQLQQEGKLKLTDKLSRFFPSFPKGDSITLHHLLSHTSGIYNYTNDSRFMDTGLTRSHNKAFMLSLFENKPFSFSPGSDMQYSNSGYLLLGYIIEQVTGNSFESEVRKRIFQPLRMVSSGFDYKNLQHSAKATGYMRLTENTGNVAVIVDSTVSFAGGSIYSTTADLLQWHLALLNNKIISQRSKETAFTPYKNKFGYGWVTGSFAGKKAVFHNGSIPGFTANIYRIEEDNTCIILLNNIANGKIDTITKHLLCVLYNKPFTLPEIRQEISMDAALLKTYTGSFAFSENFIMNIFMRDNHLFAQRAGENEKFELFAWKKHRFFLKAFEAELHFKENHNGLIDTVALLQGGKTMTAPRIATKTDPLYDEIMKMDDIFTRAFNARNIDSLKILFHPDLEFYHDKTGYTDYQDNIRRFTENFSSNKKLRRELVKESLEIYPVGEYGAIEIGIHQFYITEAGQPERPDSSPKFIHIWKKTGNKWEIIKVISYDH